MFLLCVLALQTCNILRSDFDTNNVWLSNFCHKCSALRSDCFAPNVMFASEERYQLFFFYLRISVVVMVKFSCNHLLQMYLYTSH